LSELDLERTFKNRILFNPFLQHKKRKLISELPLFM